MKKLGFELSLRIALGALSGVFFLAWCLQRLMGLVTQVHWVLGAVLGLAAAAGVIWLMRYTRRRLGQVPGAFVVVFLATGTVGMTAILGWVSYTLHDNGVAPYAVHGAATADTFVRLYLFTAIDFLPGLEVWDSLAIDAPAKPEDALAGLPILAFRIFMAAFVIDTLRLWLTGPKPPEASPA